MISIVINADTRPGQDAAMQTVGDHGEGSLQGVRSWDFLMDLPQAIHNFFLGHDHQIILYIDEVGPIPHEIRAELDKLHDELPLNWFIRPHPTNLHRWNDHLYLQALQMGELTKPNYIVHMDQDCALFRAPECDIVDRMLKWLEEYKFVCQSTNLPKEQHGMWWASTRFFMCKRETLDLEALWKALENPSSLFSKYPWTGPHHLPCLEHFLGVIAGDNGVLYPPREDGPHGYTIVNWARYHKDTLRLLNQMPYSEVASLIQDRWGLCGPSDCITQAIQ